MGPPSYTPSRPARLLLLPAPPAPRARRRSPRPPPAPWPCSCQASPGPPPVRALVDLGPIVARVAVAASRVVPLHRVVQVEQLLPVDPCLLHVRVDAQRIARKDHE